VDLVNTFKYGSDSDSGELTSFSIMANVWYDFCPDATFHPYIGGGVGWADVELDLSEAGSASYTGFAWQAAVGVGFDVTDNMRLNLEYRWFDVPDAEFNIGGTDMGIDYELQEIIVGMRINF
jgi:opacity protein-like surface antigen